MEHDLIGTVFGTAFVMTALLSAGLMISFVEWRLAIRLSQDSNSPKTKRPRQLINPWNHRNGTKGGEDIPDVMNSRECPK